MGYCSRIPQDPLPRSRVLLLPLLLAREGALGAQDSRIPCLMGCCQLKATLTGHKTRRQPWAQGSQGHGHEGVMEGMSPNPQEQLHPPSSAPALPCLSLTICCDSDLTISGSWSKVLGQVKHILEPRYEKQVCRLGQGERSTLSTELSMAEPC